MTSVPRPRRAGREAGLYGLHPTAPILARLPLLPADGGGADAVLSEGVFLASRHLGSAGTATDRSRQSVRAYELRARWRPTPHGVFAGVALATVIDGPARLCVGTRHRARTTPSSAWLAATWAMLLDDASGNDLLRQLTLTADATAVRRSERWEVEAQSAVGLGSVERRTVRATAATDMVMGMCAVGAGTGAVLNAVHARWPHAPEPVVLTTLTDLVLHGFLLTNLLGPDAGDDPIGHLLRFLSLAQPMRAPLAELASALVAADAHAPGHTDRRQALRAAREVADQICVVDRPLTVDVALDAAIGVPTALVADAVEAAGVLCRIAARHDPAAAFHQSFIARYGQHRHVPLLEVADPVIGIGVPATHRSEPEYDPRRAAVLGGLIATSYAEDSVEVELDDLAITILAGPGTTTPPRSADVYVRLVADSDHAAIEGQVRVVVDGCVPTAGSTLGRFASLLGHHHTEPETGSAVFAELAVRPRSVSAWSVAPAAGFARYRIPVGVAGTGDTDLELADLLLVSDGVQLAVWSDSLNRQVIPMLYSRLAPALLPPIARLLYLLGHAATTPWHTWSWGTAAGPFHPRIRYRNTILSSARWTLPPALVAAAANGARWDIELDRWRTGTVPPPPSTVLTEEKDRQLPLTLEHGDDRQLLRRYVRRGLTHVTEPPGGQDRTGAVTTGPHGRHLTELVIPLIRQTDPPPPRHRAALPARTHGDGLFPPGGPWLSLAIPTEPHLQDDLILRMADLARYLDDHWDSWFWLRYHTPALGPHLRVRFHGRPDILGGRALPEIGAWAATMSGQRMAGRIVVECYEQETERYGGADAIAHAEKVFAADSQLALSLLCAESDDRIAAAAHVAATITRIVADADLSALTGRHLDRIGRQMMNRLRSHVRAAHTDSDQRPGGAELFAALCDRLTAYRAVLPSDALVTCASSLIHMHANRVATSGDDEPLIRALAADLIARTL